MALNVKYKLLQNLWDPISDINTYWSKALQRLALIFMGLKFLIQTVARSEQLGLQFSENLFWGWPIDNKYSGLWKILENHKFITFYMKSWQRRDLRDHRSAFWSCTMPWQISVHPGKLQIPLIRCATLRFAITSPPPPTPPPPHHQSSLESKCWRSQFYHHW